MLYQVLTVNGALVTKRDLVVGEGVVHVVDRVLFPPTVGDLVQTLQVGYPHIIILCREHRADKNFETTKFSVGVWDRPRDKEAAN